MPTGATFRSQARELTKHASESGEAAQAAAVDAVIEEILARPEHRWKSNPVG